MWASPGADVGEAWAQTVNEYYIYMVTCCNEAGLHSTHLVHRCILQVDVWRCCAAWRGTAGGLGVVRCAVECVGSARQAFAGASAFNQNIGSWNTASVTTMDQASALAPSHTCGAHPKIFVQQWSRPQVVPGADVGVAHLGCGRVPAQMWATSGRRFGRGLAHL